MPRKGQIIEPEVRFWAKVDVGVSGLSCWTWTSSLTTAGYGNFFRGDGRYQHAHRWAYEFLVGPIPDGLHLDHLCRNRACVNPDHLEPVTNRENVMRGSAPIVNSIEGSGRTHCPQGHEYTEENTLRFGGVRACKPCRYGRARAWGSKNVRVDCAECGTRINRSNRVKHYRLHHPGVQPPDGRKVRGV